MEQEQQPALEEEDFDLAATRPPMTLGLPHTLSVTLLTAGMLFLCLFDTGDMVNDLIADAVFCGALAMVWSTAKILLRTDYHGWDIFLAWCRLDARLLDTKDWGGAHISSFPLRSIYRCEVRDDA
jgi:type IV secretory pathway VirB3-like protein